MQKENVTRTKLQAIYLLFLLMIFLLIFSISCKRDLSTKPLLDELSESQLENITVSPDFDWKTTQEVKLNLKVLNAFENPVEDVFIEIFDKNPYLSETTEDTGFNQNGAKVIFKGSTNSNGELKAGFTVASSLTEIFVCPKYIGVVQMVELTVDNELNYTFGGKQAKSISRISKQLKSISDYFSELASSVVE